MKVPIPSALRSCTEDANSEDANSEAEGATLGEALAATDEIIIVQALIGG